MDITAQEVPGGTGINSHYAILLRAKIWIYFSKILGACGARRISKDMLPRKRPTKCINYHPEEIEIQQCGRSSILSIEFGIILLLCAFTQIY